MGQRKMSETADLFMLEPDTTMPAPSTGKWTVERIKGKDGWRGISIFDDQGLRIANIVMQLDETEMKKARLIVDAVNAFRSREPQNCSHPTEKS